jgi:hypothetical protein
MAIRDVMDELADCPAAIAVGGVDLGFREAGNGGTQPLRKMADGLNVRGADAGDAGGRGAEAADGEAEVVQICQGTYLELP